MTVRIRRFGLFASLVLLTTLAASILAAGGAWPAAQNDSGVIQGIVTRAGSSEPIPDVSVTVNGLGGAAATTPARGQRSNAANTSPAARGGAALTLSARTDREGRFLIKDVAAGQYRVRAEREGYFTSLINGTTQNFVTATAIVNGPQTPALAFSLVPGSVISGRVLDVQGRPAVSMGVQALRLVYQAGGLAQVQEVVSTNTDDRGEYRLFRIPPGVFYIGVVPQSLGARGFDGLANLVAGRGANLDGRGSKEIMLQTYYPSATTVGEGLPVNLVGGEELTGLDITMRKSPAITVSGLVTSTVSLGTRTGPRGNIMTTSVQLTLVPGNEGHVYNPAVRVTGRAVMDESQTGPFQLTGIAPGIYDLFARAPNNTAAAGNTTTGASPTEPTSFFGRTTFQAGYEDIQNLSVVIRPGVDVKAHVTVDGSATFPQDSVRVMLRPAESGAITGFLAGSPAGQLSADRSIDFRFVSEGLYRFQTAIQASAGAPGQRGAAAGSNAYVEDIREGGVGVYDNGLKVGTQPPGLVEIIIKTNGGTIEGTVSDSQKNGSLGAVVALVPVESRRKNPELFKTTFAAGREFVFRAVPPGAYKVFAWENVAVSMIQSPAFLSKYEQRGHSIVVNPSTTTNANVAVIRSEK